MLNRPSNQERRVALRSSRRAIPRTTIPLVAIIFVCALSSWFGLELFTPAIGDVRGHFSLAEGRVTLTLFWADVGDLANMPPLFRIPGSPRVHWMPALSPIPKSAGIAIPLWPVLLGLMLWAWVVWRRRTARMKRFLCLRCGYPLLDQQLRCPECGTPANPVSHSGTDRTGRE